MNTDELAIEHANQWLNEHGLPKPEHVRSLAEAAADGDIDAEEELRNLAESHSIEWSEDFSRVADQVIEALESQTADDAYGAEVT